MRLIKRISSSISATLDNAVGQIENHDAIVEATIREVRQSVAKTKARINTLRHQENVYRKQLDQAREQQQLWEQRATKLADINQQQALECIARRNHCNAEINRLEQSLEQQITLIREVTQNLQKLQNKLDEMTQKHNLMRSRQSVADVNRAVAKSNLDDSIEDTFERWESVVLENEFMVSDAFAHDPLELALGEQEHQSELKAQLAALTDKTGNS